MARRARARRGLRRLDAERRRQLGGEEVLRRALALALLALATVGVAADARAQGDDDVVQPARAADRRRLRSAARPARARRQDALLRVQPQHDQRALSPGAGRPGAKLAFDEGADVTWPRLSPDGKRILYISFRDDAAGQLCVRDLPDKHRRCLRGRGQRAAGAVDRQRAHRARQPRLARGRPAARRASTSGARCTGAHAGASAT